MMTKKGLMPRMDRRIFLGTTAALAGTAATVRAGEPTAVDAGDQSSLGKTPHTKFAVNVEMWFRGQPFLDRIRQSAALGFPAFEFWGWQGKPIDEAAALSKELGIKVAQFVAGGGALNEPSGHAKFVEGVTAACQTAKKLDCNKMTILAGNDVKGMTTDEMHDQIIAGLKLAAPVVEEHQVMLIIEPLNTRVDHRGYCLARSEDAIRICQQVDSPMVKINWDLYHQQITEGDLCGHLREGFESGQIGYLQLADHPGRNEPGTGEIHYNRVLREAYDLGYRGYVGLECRPKEGELIAAKRVAAADVW